MIIYAIEENVCESKMCLQKTVKMLEGFVSQGGKWNLENEKWMLGNFKKSLEILNDYSITIDEVLESRGK